MEERPEKTELEQFLDDQAKEASPPLPPEDHDTLTSREALPPSQDSPPNKAAPPPEEETAEEKRRARTEAKPSPKMRPLSEVEKESRRRDEWRGRELSSAEKAEEAQKSLWVLRRMALVGILLLFGIGAYVYLGSTRAPEEGNRDFSRRDDTARIRSLNGVSDALVETLRQFLDAPDHQGRLAFVRKPEQVAPLMLEHYRHRPQDLAIKVTSPSGELFEVESGGGSFKAVLVDLDNYSRRGAIFERVGEEWKLDWESFIGFSGAPWEPFLNGQVEGSKTFRAVFEQDDYYNFDYADPDAFSCYRIRDGKSEIWGWVYCERGSETDKQLEATIKAGKGGKGEAILQLSHQSSRDDSRQLWCDAFLQKNHFAP